MVIIDTSVWIDYLNAGLSAESAWLNRQLTRQRLGLTDIILCEVLQGIRHESQVDQTRAYLCDFDVWATGGTSLAVASARNFRVLRAKGHTIRTTIDCLIATFCIEGGHELLHRDRDFEPFETLLGLRVVHA